MTQISSWTPPNGYPMNRIPDEPKGELIPVTVCVAAMFTKPGPGVVCASDRMLTTGNIQFQPPTPKIWPLTNAIYMLVAGDDMSIQHEIYQEVLKTVNDRIAKEKDNWWRLKDVAYLYSRSYSALRKVKAEHSVLSPLGLTFDTFYEKQASMDSSFVADINTKLSEFELPATRTIIAGVDPTGAHLYVISDGNVSCNDMTGFAAVGSGNWHANSHFMLSGYSAASTGERAILIAHQSKKKAEVAPGVGKDTDMVMIGPGLGFHVVFRTDVIATWDKFYDEYTQQIGELDKKAEKNLYEHVASMVKKTASQQGEKNPLPDGGEEVKTPPEKK